jgi:hypothetical protein
MAFFKTLGLFLLLAGAASSTDVDTDLMGPNSDGLDNDTKGLRGRELIVSYIDQYVPGRNSKVPGIPIGTVTVPCTGTEKVVAPGLTESKCGFLERDPCVDPYSVSPEVKDDYRTDQSCLDGTCGGCCRSFHFLKCDPDGRSASSYVPCVCNEGTVGGNPFPPLDPFITAAPVAPAAPSPIPAPIPVPFVPVTAPYPPPPSVIDAYSGVCIAAFKGLGLGQKPRITPPDFPSDLTLGECTKTSHCEGTSGECCK